MHVCGRMYAVPVPVFYDVDMQRSSTSSSLMLCESVGGLQKAEKLGGSRI